MTSRGTLRDRIEQAAARGDRPEYTAAREGCDISTVHRALARLDKINAEPPPPVLSPCGTYAAYKRHNRHKTAPCGPCRTAARRYREKTRLGAAGTPADVARIEARLVYTRTVPERRPGWQEMTA